jgi:IS30 family transposase
MKLPTYTRLTFNEREEISRGLWRDESFADIAERLGRKTSTVSREVFRNGGRKYYRAKNAAATFYFSQRLKRSVCKIELVPALKEYVLAKLRLNWSPQQISNRLRKEYPYEQAMQISHESIYTYIYILPRGELKKELISHLRQKRKLRENRKGKVAEENRGHIPEMISIEERPAEVADRIIPGHWESDLIMGKQNQTAIGTIVERTTRATILVPLGAKKDAATVRRAFARELRELPAALKLSLTHDQGREMTQHKLFTQQTKIKVYFAHPHSPWERGTNENTNGLLRQYFPKGTDLSRYSRKEIKHVQDLLNGRPRKALGYQTPHEAFAELLR